MKPNKNISIPETEARSFSAGEIRASSEGQPPKISGYAAVFNQLSEDLGGFFERISPGAFTNSLKNDDQRALFNHNTGQIMGRVSANTMKLSEDKTGLAFEIDPPDTQWVRDLITSIRRGDISQMSFGFRTIKDNWEMVGDQIIRTLSEVKLLEISPVTFPAYPQTSANVRSAFEAFQKDHEDPGQEPGSEQLQDDAGARARLANQRRRLDLIERL